MFHFVYLSFSLICCIKSHQRCESKHFTFQKMSQPQNPTTSTGANITINNNTQRSGLMAQSTMLLTNEVGGASSSSQQTKKSEPVKVENIRTTLQNSKLTREFRAYIRDTLDKLDRDIERKKMEKMKKPFDPESKFKFEQMLDWVLDCEKIFDIPESDVEARKVLLIQIVQKYLGRKNKGGYDMAMPGQINRSKLIEHGKKLSEQDSALKPDVDLLKDPYSSIYSQLEQKHDLFKSEFNKTTTLQAFLCALL